MIIHTNSEKDLSLLQALAQKMGFKSQVLTSSYKEHIVMGKAIEENNQTEQLKLGEAAAYYHSLNKAK